MSSARTTPLKRATIAIAGLEGMAGLETKLKQNLEAAFGVKSAFVSPRTEMVYVVYDSKRVNLLDLQAIIEELGLVASCPVVH